jgi:hypothetical protein
VAELTKEHWSLSLKFVNTKKFQVKLVSSFFYYFFETLGIEIWVCFSYGLGFIIDGLELWIDFVIRL